MSMQVWLLVDGRRYGGWLSVSISASINRQARAFGVACTYDTPEGLSSLTLKAGSALQVYIGDNLICSGYIDQAAVSYDSGQIAVQVSGRSKTCDLVDCCPAPPGTSIPSLQRSWASQPPEDAQPSAVASAVWTWQGCTVEQIITELAAPYGISVRVLSSELASKLTNFTVTPGQTVFQCIQKLVTIANLVVCDDEQGSLVIAEPGSAGFATDALVSGANILSAEAANDVSQLMSSYQVLGQHQGGDDITPSDSCSDEGLTADSAVGRPRFLTIVDAGQQTSIDQCQQQADFEAAYRLAQSQKFTVTVQGWTQSTGELWKINSLVQVDDSIIDRHGQFLITDADYSLDDGGSLTRLTLMPLEGYRAKAATITPQKSTTKKAAGSSSAAGSSQWADVRPIERDK